MNTQEQKISKQKNTLRWIKENLWMDFIIIMLTIVSISLLIYELSADLLAEQIGFLHTVDLVIAFVFLFDFIIGMYLAEDKKKYLKENWPDIIASIPITTGVYRSLRGLRILRLVRIIRVITRIRKIGIVANKIADSSSKYIYISAITSTVILSGAVAFFSLEFGVNTQVNNFYDAIWYAVVTTTTVGYGDIYPVTWEGRLIGMLLMFFGMGLVGTTAGLVGSHLLQKQKNKIDPAD